MKSSRTFEEKVGKCFYNLVGEQSSEIKIRNLEAIKKMINRHIN